MAQEAIFMIVARRALIALCVVLALAASGFGWLNRDTAVPSNWTLGSAALDIGFPIGALAMAVVAELAARRDPRHLVAWTFLLLGLGAELLLVAQSYGVYGTITAPGVLPAAPVLLWLATWSWSIPMGALVVALLVFPDGQTLGPRWWIAAWVSVVASFGQGFADAFRTPIYLSHTGMVSPLGAPFPVEVLDALALVGTTAWSLATLAAAASLVIRFRRATGIERLQLKWVALGFGAAAVGIVLASIFYAFPGLGPLSGAVGSVGVLLIPISAAFAILRYRLYDVDVVIERTLVYATLSASVGATYWVLVILLQSALRPITSGNELAIAGSTLATLALIQPLRARIHRAVDRRFYRDRYDAVRAVDAFSARLRDEVALESVRGDLLETVDQTVQPATASLWLRNDSRTPAG
jgi:hypothetical protein